VETLRRSDIAVLGSMTARRSRPPEKKAMCVAGEIDPTGAMHALPQLWATRCANVCLAVRFNLIQKLAQDLNSELKVQSPAERNPISRLNAQS
jgi:hypothetical protein